MESKTSLFMVILSDEVSFGDTGEISLVDRRSLTETARAVNFEPDGFVPAQTKRLEVGIARERNDRTASGAPVREKGRWDTCKW